MSAHSDGCRDVPHPSMPRLRRSLSPLGTGKICLGVLLLTLSLLWPISSDGQELTQRVIATQTPQKISLVQGKSLVIESPQPVKRVSLGAPEIADTVVLSPRQIYVVGKAVGTTNLTFFGGDDRVSTIFDVEISPDVSRLKEKLNNILAGENIRVSASHDSITLYGEVSSTAKLSQALALAQAFAPDKVVNLLQVSGVHQVMLEVRVAEMSRSMMRRLGFNFAYVGAAGDFAISRVGNLISSVDIASTGLSATFSQSVNALFRFLSGNTTVTGFVDALKENGLVKILAEPTLVTLSGQRANFLAGGEFPIPVPQDRGVITIEFKTFGVGLSFTPNVLSDNKISMTVAPEVSELDFANAVVLSGAVVPALTTRRASTTIELADGQSFAIAGLLRENVRQIVSKFPLLGDIPILGALFRSTSFQKNESELIIIVTPHLVKPLDLTKQTLPTDAYIEPNDLEFYLFGALEGRGESRKIPRGLSLALPDRNVGLDGEFGHIIP